MKRHSWHWQNGDPTNVERCRNAGCTCQRKTRDSGRRYVYRATVDREWLDGAPECIGGERKK